MNRLIKRMLALAVAGTITATTLTGCAYKQTDEEIKKVSELANSLSEEISEDNLTIDKVFLSGSMQNGIVIIIGEKDNKKFKVKYSVAREDYLKLIYDVNAYYEIYANQLTSEHLQALQNIINTCEPIEIKTIDSPKQYFSKD